MAQDERVIQVACDWRFLRAKTNLAVHKRYFANQWNKEAAILPCRYDKSGWEIIPYNRVNPRSQYFATLGEVDAWLQGKYDFSLTPDAIEHLEKLEAKSLMYKMAKDAL